MRHLLLTLLLLATIGCGPGGAPGRPAGRGDLDKLQKEMTVAFGALEMYAHDHTLEYPERLELLVPKYLDTVPNDPLDGKPLGYQKTERGYLLLSSADYTPAGAQKSFPQMDQDGFFALKTSDFPSEETGP